MASDDYKIAQTSSSDAIRAQKIAQTKAEQRAVRQQAAAAEFEEWGETAVFNPLAISRRFEKLEKKVMTERSSAEGEEAEQTGTKDVKVEQVKKSEEAATRFHKKNPELEKRALLNLRSRIQSGDTPEEILRKVLEEFPDFYLADESMEFLLDTSEGELAQKIAIAREKLNQMYGKEIRAGRNTRLDVASFSQQGLGGPSQLRGLYQELTSAPKETISLFEEFHTKYSLEEQMKVIKFLLHALGSDIKSKGPSIDSNELVRLMTQMRSIQGIWGLYRFFQSRIKKLQDAFWKNGLSYPPRVTYDLLAKLYVQFLQERYPSSEKLKQLALQMGISKELLAQILIFNQYRDAMRQASPKLFRNEQHRQDVFRVILDTLESLEEDLEDQQEEE